MSACGVSCTASCHGLYGETIPTNVLGTTSTFAPPNGVRSDNNGSIGMVSGVENVTTTPPDRERRAVGYRSFKYNYLTRI